MSQICRRCKEAKPLEAFGPNNTYKAGIDSMCRSCHAEKARARRASMTPEAREKAAQQCREWKAANSEKVAAYNDLKKDERREYFKRYRAENAERLKQRDRAYQIATADRRKAYSANRYALHRSRILASAKERLRANRTTRRIYESRRRRENPEFHRASGANYRARKRTAAGRHSAKDVANLLASQRWTCPVCRASLRGGFHVDHVVPLSRGGSNDRLNLQCLCPTCNKEKHAKHPIDFMQERGFLL